MTFNIFKSIKDLHIHKLNKKYQFSSKIVDYVKENNGCTLNDITKNITNNKLRALRALSERGLHARHYQQYVGFLKRIILLERKFIIRLYVRISIK